MSDFHRPLYYYSVASDFVEKVLGVSRTDPNFFVYVNKIVTEERSPYPNSDTLNSWKVRDRRYRTEQDRMPLRNQIVYEMLSMRRLPDDEQVMLGHGGGKPLSGVKSQRKAFYIMGLPASGKSSICGSICDLYGAFLLDSDLIKRKLPEFKRKKGASLVHEESSVMTMGGMIDNQPFDSLFKQCYYSGYNICIPKIGSKIMDITRLFYLLRFCGYSIYVVLVSLERDIATRRAFNRFLKTNRYVSLSMIFDGYANDPILCYYRLRKYMEDRGKRLVTELVALSSNVAIGKPYKILDQRFSGPILERYLATL